LYHDIDARVLVNGHLTNPFPILRSVKQGDALSCILFILCMETLTSNIENNPNISNPRLPRCILPKSYSYADDVAILVNSANEIQKVFDVYASFSRVSGHFLNVDKTEILNLTTFIPDESFVIVSNDVEANITAVESLVICGKIFSLNANIEFNYNVTSKLEKMSAALSQWRRRPLSIYGRT